MLARAKDYRQTAAGFRWAVPERFNIGIACCDDWAKAEPGRIALFDHTPGQAPTAMTYGQLKRQSDALAAWLAQAGIRRGDRVALMLPQCFETAISHIAVYKLGAIAVPLALLFGIEALSHRLAGSGAAAIITTKAGLGKLDGLKLPALGLKLCIDGDADFQRILAGDPGDFTPADTLADDPAMMIFTSGTTGPPKGALHGHRVLLGHVPGVQVHHEFLPQTGDLLWTPADWAWAGGLLNVLLPGLLFGVPVVAGRFERFDPEAALLLMEKAGVRNAFIPPTALRMLRAVDGIAGRFRLNLRTIGSGGESLGKETWDWGREAFGLQINEFYGQTECNLVLSSCAALGVMRPGAIGLAVPGHEVAVIDGEGRPSKFGQTGQIAVKRPDPVMFLGYWQDPDATAKKFIGDWMTTGDQGVMDPDGYVHFFGRDDDVITSSGYRIGPGEVEDCLAGHPAVALSAVVGKPDPLRTEIVMAFVVLKPGFTADEAQKKSIQGHVRERLSAHEYPREVEFTDSIPLTTSGKVIRRLFRESLQKARA